MKQIGHQVTTTGTPPDDVVGHLPHPHQTNRVGARVAVDLQAHHQLVVEELGLVCRDERRTVDGCDGVDRRARPVLPWVDLLVSGRIQELEGPGELLVELVNRQTRG